MKLNHLINYLKLSLIILVLFSTFTSCVKSSPETNNSNGSGGTGGTGTTGGVTINVTWNFTTPIPGCSAMAFIEAGVSKTQNGIFTCSENVIVPPCTLRCTLTAGIYYYTATKKPVQCCSSFPIVTKSGSFTVTAGSSQTINVALD